MENTRKQNLKYFKYKHIYYTGCVKYAIFTCLTTVQIIWKRQETFLMQNHRLKRDTVIIASISVTHLTLTIKMIISE